MIGSIDRPSGGTHCRPEEVTVQGWALDLGGPAVEVLVTAACEGITEAVAIAELGEHRADVGAAHSSIPNAAHGGWQAKLNLRSCRGETVITAIGRTAGGAWEPIAQAGCTVRPEAGIRRKIAVFTLVQDEAFFLPGWLRHYAAQVPAEDIFILDHDSTDGSTTGLPIGNVVPVHHSATFDHDWMRSITEEFQRFLLGSYDVVIHSDADELLLADPAEHPSLLDYAEAMSAPAARATGWNVVHHDGEPPWDPAKSITEQRSWWHRVQQYDKTLMTTRPLSYEHGFHTQDSVSLEPDPSLLLLHLHRVDRQRCLARHRASAAKRWSVADVESGRGFQHRIVDPAEFAEWFFAGADLGSRERARIPSHLQGHV